MPVQQYCHRSASRRDSSRTHLSTSSVARKEESNGAYLTKDAFVRMCRVHGIVPSIAHHNVK